MPDTVGGEGTHASTSKRPRTTPEFSEFPPLKRPKTSQDPTATPAESIVSYDACPMPSVVDYFYEDLIPKAPELSQLFPTLCHDVYVVRRWLGSAGCTIYWTMIMEDINRTTNAPNLSHPLAGLIARSLAKLRDPRRETSSSKFHTLCETLRPHLEPGGTSRIVVFSKFWQLQSVPEANYKQCVTMQLHELPYGC